MNNWRVSLDTKNTLIREFGRKYSPSVLIVAKIENFGQNISFFSRRKLNACDFYDFYDFYYWNSNLNATFNIEILLLIFVKTIYWSEEKVA